MKRFVVIMTFLVILLSLSSCRDEIPGENAAYYTEAINSLLWCRGNSSDGTQKYAPEIGIVETDTYGRVLFSYKEGFSADNNDLSNLNIYAFLIMQATDDEFVYYYEDVNFVCLNYTDYREDVCSRQIDELKTDNDWGREFNSKKCIKKTKSTKPIRENYDGIVKDYIDLKKKEAGVDLRVCFSGQDNYGRILISMSEFGRNPCQGKLIVCIIQPDDSVICSDDYNLTFNYFEYYDDLQVLKNEANWNNEFIAA